MEALLAPLVIIVLLVFAPFIALQAYILVWILGPAIRRAGRKWEEGRLEAQERWQKQHGPAAAEGQGAPAAPSPVVPSSAEQVKQATVAPTEQPRHTITGRRIR